MTPPSLNTPVESNFFEAGYRRSDSPNESPTWMILSHPKTGQRRFDTLSQAREAVKAWYHFMQATTIDTSTGLTIAFPPSKATYQTKIIKVFRRSECIEFTA